MESKLVLLQLEERGTPEVNSDFVMDIDEENKRSKPKGFLKLLKANSVEFCQSTSLHGLQYTSEKNRHVLERFFWLAAFLLSSCVAVYYIHKIWYKWNTAPVLVSFSDAPTSVWNIPFPAVTICPQVKVKQTVFNYSTVSKKKELTEKEFEKLQFSQLVCGTDFDTQFYGNDTLDSRAIDFIEEVAPTLSDVIIGCMWRLNRTSCDTMFTSVLTDVGLCYTFNTLSSKDLFRSNTIQHNSKHLNHSQTLNWNLDDGYADDDMIDTFPHHSLTSGAYGGLALFIGMNDKDMDPECNFAIHGFQVLLHSPADFPTVEEKSFRVPLNRHVIVGIRPRIMVTDVGLRPYPPEKRQCYFATERHLRHFRTYTQPNCDLECLTNYTLLTCGCVSYHMPRDRNVPICGPAKMRCLRNVAGNFTTDDNGLFKCKCMPACTEISYDVEISQAEFSWVDHFKGAELNYIDFEKRRLTVVYIYYKERQFVTSRRGELYGLADFLASCGGLLGLLLGFSLLSAVEIIYYFTVRLFCNFRANKKKHPAP